MCCSKPRSSKRKREDTPDIVEGLINAAEIIYQHLPHGKKSQRQVRVENEIPEPADFGRYQARVVVMALAAELALKFAYEQEYRSEPAPPIHDLHKLFGKLGEGKKRKVEANYESLMKEYKRGFGRVGSA